MANINDVFGGGFLKAEDLKGRNAQVTIREVEVKDFDDGKKLIIHFHGKDKALVCNKTNASIIEEVLGSGDTDDWLDKQVTLITKKVEFQGKLVPAIRVALDEPPPSRPPQRQAPMKAKTVEPIEDDNIPMGEESDIPF